VEEAAAEEITDLRTRGEEVMMAGRVVVGGEEDEDAMMGVDIDKIEDKEEEEKKKK
jgi:hypothetical protein